ncbi:MAG: decaprenyl-phosphate phosphoribosyltransferase [bacterium]|nr:decaprenyl-phosphate phosphoribosyltransferase [bacterium]
MTDTSAGGTARALIELARPRQWVKNAFVFAPIIFDKRINDASAFSGAAAAFVLFCMYSACVYMMNDIADLERDRLHPKKRNRPLPSGRLSVKTAAAACLILLTAAIACSAALSRDFLLVGLAYFASNILYSFWCRSIVILDGMIIALGFLLRLYAGAVVIGALVSNWLYLCGLFVSLFLAFCKRRHEIILLGDGNAPGHRAILKEYSTQYLDQIISIVTASTAVTYSLYCLDKSQLGAAPHSSIMLTIPFVLYGLLRYLYLVYQKEEGGNPSELLVSDKPILINGVLWLGVVLWAIYIKG